MRSILIFSLALVLAGCGRKASDFPLDQSISDRILDESTFDAATLAMVQQDTGIALPDGSRGLYMFYQGSTLDPSFVAKIQIPSATGDDLARRLEQLPNQDGMVNGSLTEKVTWWNPSGGIVRVQRQYNPNGNYLRAILTQENDLLALYLEWIKI